MLEVSISVLRGPGAVYFAGETVQCNVLIKNIDSSNVEKVAWASAQIHCICYVNENKVRVSLPSSKQNAISELPSDTAFVPNREDVLGDKGYLSFASKPTILFCDLCLNPGESKTYKYSETLPYEIPPSFRGHFVKYLYKITIGTQRLSDVAKMIRIPLRVLVLDGLESFVKSNEDPPPSHPFLERSPSEHTFLEAASQHLQMISARRSHLNYRVSSTGGRIATVSLFKAAYRIGEDIVGTIDFSDVQQRCLQYSITLKSDEQIPEEYRKKPNQGSYVSVHARHHEYCLHLKRSYFALPIPLTVSPGFVSSLVCLRWHVHFEFAISCNDIPKHKQSTDSAQSSTSQGPATVTAEVMEWNLPIKIHPANPVLVSAATKGSSSVKQSF